MLNILNPLKKWSVHNPLKSWTLHGLSKREVKLLRLTFSPVESQLCLVWKQGWPEWKKVNDPAFAEIDSVDISSEAEAPSIPPSPAPSEDEITQVRLIAKEPVRLRSNRRHDRFEVLVPVEIIQNRTTFRTETVDVSESGIRFKDHLPDWVAGYFTVIFRFPQACIEITCALVEDQKQSKDRAEVIDTNDEESGLAQYLNWVRSIEASRSAQVKE